MYERIKEEMRKNGIKYDSELERMAGIAAGSLKNIKNGHAPSPKTVVKIAGALGVGINYLVTGEVDNRLKEQEYIKKKQEALDMVDRLTPAQIDTAHRFLKSLASSIDITPTVEDRDY